MYIHINKSPTESWQKLAALQLGPTIPHFAPRPSPFRHLRRPQQGVILHVVETSSALADATGNVMNPYRNLV